LFGLERKRSELREGQSPVVSYLGIDSITIGGFLIDEETKVKSFIENQNKLSGFPY
jgi:hypothetical protein